MDAPNAQEQKVQAPEGQDNIEPEQGKAGRLGHYGYCAGRPNYRGHRSENRVLR